MCYRISDFRGASPFAIFSIKQEINQRPDFHLLPDSAADLYTGCVLYLPSTLPSRYPSRKLKCFTHVFFSYQALQLLATGANALVASACLKTSKCKYLSVDVIFL